MNGAMENTTTVPRKRRSKQVFCESGKEVEEGHKKARVVPWSEKVEKQIGLCEVTKEEYRRSLWGIYHKITVHLGPKEIAALCSLLEGVGSSEELSSLVRFDRINTKATNVGEMSSLEAKVEGLRARNAKLEKCIEEISQIVHIDPQTAKEKDLELESGLQKSLGLKGAPVKKIDHLETRAEMQSVNNGPSMMMEATQFEDCKPRIGELENRVVATSSQAHRVGSCGKDERDENSPEELLHNTALREELNRIRAHSEMTGYQLELEIDKKREAIAELKDLQDQKAIYEATKAELVELRKQKQMFEAEKTELAELRSLKRTLEADRDELAALRSQKKAFEAAESEFKALFESLPHHGAQLKDAAEELQTLRSQKETLQAAIEELSGSQDLKVKQEAISQDTAAVQRQRASFEATVTEEKQRELSETGVEELDEPRKQQDMSRPGREEIESLRQEITITEAADKEFINFHGRETARTVREQSLMAKGERLIQRQARLMRTISDLEEKRTEDKHEYDRCCLELEAAMKKISETSVTLNAAEQKLVSVHKENEILQEEKIRVLGEKQAVQVEKDGLFQDKQNLERRLHRAKEQIVDLQGEKNPLFQEKQSLKRKLRHADEHVTGLQEEKNRLFQERQTLERRFRHSTEHITDLRFEIESLQKAKTRAELDATILNKDLFARIERLELRLKQEKYDAEEASAEKMFGDAEALDEFNSSYPDQERGLRNELKSTTMMLATAQTQLHDAAAKALCSICLGNTRDTVILPCTHMQSCMRCVKELLQRDKPCPTCHTAISGFVACNQAD